MVSSDVPNVIECRLYKTYFKVIFQEHSPEVNLMSYGFKPAPVEVDKEYEVEIANMSRRGDSGVAKNEGFIIFLPDTKLGDKVKIKITKIGRRYAITELLK
jgi:predicted RNA-binding protein with TRAM domain